MLAQGQGKIINTASMASLLVPHPQKQAAYNASKAAGVCVLHVESGGVQNDAPCEARSSHEQAAKLLAQHDAWGVNCTSKTG